MVLPAVLFERRGDAQQYPDRNGKDEGIYVDQDCREKPVLNDAVDRAEVFDLKRDAEVEPRQDVSPIDEVLN